MCRYGKIARLPKNTRDDINLCLRDGRPAEDILKWVNEDPNCRRILAKEFDSRPITKQNLSQWKHGGYQAWLRLQHICEQVQSLREQPDDLDANLFDKSIADRIAMLLSVQLLNATQQLETIKDPKERWEQLKDLLHELHRLRREDHHGDRARLALEQWEVKRSQQEDAYDKAQEEAEKQRQLKWFRSLHNLPLKASLLGGGEYGRKWAEWVHCVENDEPLPKWWTDPDSELPPPRRPDPPVSAEPRPADSHPPSSPSPSVKVSQSKSRLEQASSPPPSQFAAAEQSERQSPDQPVQSVAKLPHDLKNKDSPELP